MSGLLLTLVVLGAFASPAGAATLTHSTSSTGKVTFTLTASAGERNTVSVASPAQDEYTLRDSTATINESSSLCTKTLSVVTCKPPSEPNWVAALRDGDDAFVTGKQVDGVVTARGEAGRDRLVYDALTLAGGNRFEGGPDDDDISTGLGADFVDAGSGNDLIRRAGFNANLLGGDGNDTFLQTTSVRPQRFLGGPGIDTTSYSGRKGAVVVRLEGSPNDGAVNERDNVEPDVENVTGGNGSDTIVALLTSFLTTPHQLRGQSGDDRLEAGPGADTLDGGFGDDVLLGGRGADVLAGGDGFDTVSYADRTGPVVVTLHSGTDDGEPGEADQLGVDVERVLGGAGPDTIAGSERDEQLDGAGGADSLDGGGGADSLLGAAGEDLLDGGIGDDVLEGGAGSDTLDGGTGFDRVTYEHSAAPVDVSLDGIRNDGAAGELDFVRDRVESVSGSELPDRLTGDSASNALSGRSGNDVLSAGDGEDSLTGGLGDDLLDGGLGSDTIDGQLVLGILPPSFGFESLAASAHDTVTYAGRTSRLLVDLSKEGGGEAGEGDVIKSVSDVIGGAADDILIGNGLHNRLQGGPGTDTLTGGIGLDVADYSERTDPVSVDFDGVADDGAPGENDVLDETMEGAAGGAGADLLAGGPGVNVLIGGPGFDRLAGLAGDDEIDASDGAPDIVGCGEGASDFARVDLQDTPAGFPDCEATDSAPVDEHPVVQLSHSGRLTVRRGRAAVRAACPRSAPRTCRGHLTLAWFGRASYRVGRGRTRSIRLRVSRRALGRRLALTASERDPRGRLRSATRRVRVSGAGARAASAAR